jgi:hypothetical protein
MKVTMTMTMAQCRAARARLRVATRPDAQRAATLFLGGLAIAFAAACTRPDAAPPAPAAPAPPQAAAPEPQASVQEVMDAIVDPAADDIWDAVATTVTRKGTQEHQPRSAQQWQALRRRVITLVESTNLLVIPGRRATQGYVPSEGPGVLDSKGVQSRIDGGPAAFAVFALNLRQAALGALQAVDARDPQALLRAGGRIDAACEQCHQAYWYPDQKIPAPRPLARPAAGA